MIEVLGKLRGGERRRDAFRRELPRLRTCVSSETRESRLPPSAGWIGSLTIHATLLFFGFSLLVRPAHFDVLSGKTSTAIVLVAAPSPARALPVSPTPTRPIEVAPLVAQPVLPPLPVPVLQPPLPVVRPQPVPPPVVRAVPSVEPAKTSLKMADRPRPALSAAAKGAVQAQPDDLHNDPPVYPEESRAAREEGVVLLRVDVSAAGRPSEVSILKSSGYFRLDQAARRAVRDWRFRPASQNDTAIDSQVDVPVRFRLE